MGYRAHIASTAFLIGELRKACREAGGQRAWCRTHGFTMSYASMIVNGHCEMTDKVAYILGYYRHPGWVKIKDVTKKPKLRHSKGIKQESTNAPRSRTLQSSGRYFTATQAEPRRHLRSPLGP